MSDVVLLRKLAYKSTFNFGKYYDYTVYQLFCLSELKAIKYLTWVYYNASNISFTDEILDRIFITEELRIKKPGKVSSESEYADFCGKLKAKRTANFLEKTEDEKDKIIKRNRKEGYFDKKHERIILNIKQNKMASKINNRKRNQKQ